MTFMHVFDKLYASRINLNIKRSTLPQDHIQVAQKTGTLCFVCINFVKYRPIFRLILQSKSEEHL